MKSFFASNNKSFPIFVFEKKNTSKQPNIRKTLNKEKFTDIKIIF